MTDDKQKTTQSNIPEEGFLAYRLAVLLQHLVASHVQSSAISIIHGAKLKKYASEIIKNLLSVFSETDSESKLIFYNKALEQVDNFEALILRLTDSFSLPIQISREILSDTDNLKQSIIILVRKLTESEPN